MPRDVHVSEFGGSGPTFWDAWSIELGVYLVVDEVRTLGLALGYGADQ